MLSDLGVPVEIANAFGYNQRSEVTEATMGTNSYGYAYDPIGNRLTAAANAATNVYASNPLNQYTNIAGGSASSPTYDADGNMLTCALPTGEWRFFWDGENRLVCASNAATLVRNTYDSQSRRIRKEVSVYDSQLTAYRLQSSASFLWDNWNVIREVQHSNIPPFQSSTNYYTWGVDLSGSLQGAGGVGGLLSVTTTDINSGTSTNYYPCYDANGNVTAYLDADGQVVAAFEYDAFGNAMSETVAAGLHLPFRFSTKYWDTDTDLYYYGYRYYVPILSRWVNRDPLGDLVSLLSAIDQAKTLNQKKKLIDESVGPLYLFANNNPVCFVDADGRLSLPSSIIIYETMVHIFAMVYGKETYRGGDPYNKCLRHCNTSCIITKWNLLVPITAVTGSMFELWEWFAAGRSNATGWQDIYNNLRGCGAAWNVFSSCSGPCEKKCECEKCK